MNMARLGFQPVARSRGDCVGTSTVEGKWLCTRQAWEGVHQVQLARVAHRGLEGHVFASPGDAEENEEAVAVQAHCVQHAVSGHSNRLSCDGNSEPEGKTETQ